MLKWLLVGAGGLVAVVAALLVAVPWLVDLPRVQAAVAQGASQALGRPVRFTALSASALPWPSLRLRGLRVAEDARFGPDPFLTVREATARIRLWPLVTGRVELGQVVLSGLEVRLIEEGGQWNVASLGGVPAAARAGGRPGGPGLGGAAAGGGAALSRVRVEGGVVEYLRRGAALGRTRLEGIEATVAATSGGLAFEGKATGTPGRVRLAVSEGSLALAPGRGLGEAALSATVEVDAEDLAPLARAWLAEAALAGTLKGRFKLGGTAERLMATGEVTLPRLTLRRTDTACPPPPERSLALADVRAPVAWATGRLTSQPLRLRAAGGTLQAETALALAGPGPWLALRNVQVKGVEMAALLVDYLCQGYAVTGPLDLSGEATMSHDWRRTLGGSARLRIGPGRVVGGEALAVLGEVARLAGLAAPLLDPHGAAPTLATPLAFEAITATLRIAGGVVRTDDLLYRSRALTVSAVGTYRLADTRVDMDLTLGEGRTQVKARVVGTLTPRSLRIVPTVVVPDAGGVRRFLERLWR